MSSKFLLSLFLFALLFISAKGTCQDSVYHSFETVKVIDSSEIIGIVTFEEYEAKNIRSVRFSQMYKGWVYQQSIIEVSAACVLPEGEYLIFSRFTQFGENRMLTLDSCTYAIPLHKANPFIAEIQQYLSCKVEQKGPVGACERRYDLVCGCDGKTYGNACKANRAGVMFYKFGPCN